MAVINYLTTVQFDFGALRLVIADGVDQLASQRADRPRVEQQHAILVEPDLAFVHVEAQARAHPLPTARKAQRAFQR
mgnify:CR=1 FL=1